MLKNLCFALGAVSAVSHHHHHHRSPFHELVSLQSDPICGSGGCEKTLPAAPEGHPMDYFVPNFGVDADILANKKSLEIAEKTTGHKWEFKFCEKGKPCNPALWTKYNFAPELSDDVKSTQDSISLAEDQIGH